MWDLVGNPRRPVFSQRGSTICLLFCCRTEVVKAHVLNGTLLSGSLQNGASVNTLHGNAVTIDTTAGQYGLHYELLYGQSYQNLYFTLTDN